MVSNFVTILIKDFLVAFGVVIGASVFGGIASIITDRPPLKSMLDISSSIKIWAMAIALGDTFSSYKILEKGIFEGEIRTIIKQGLYVITAIVGANSGHGLIVLIKRCEEMWNR